MINLTEEQISKVANCIPNLADKNLNYEEFKGKLSQIGITGSDEDIKAFKVQIMDIYNKRDKLVKLSENELEKAIGGGVGRNLLKGIASTSLFALLILLCLPKKNSGQQSKPENVNKLETGWDYSAEYKEWPSSPYYNLQYDMYNPPFPPPNGK